MHPHQTLLQCFYQAFQRRDYTTMAACYHPEATFEDAIFRLQGPEIGQMWQMLCLQGPTLRLTYDGVLADEQQGQATWDARYTFSQTKRPVHNHTQARFTFQDGLIRSHHDQFSFWRWSRQALGIPGWLLGWSGILQRQVQAKARQSLTNFMNRPK